MGGLIISTVHPLSAVAGALAVFARAPSLSRQHRGELAAVVEAAAEFAELARKSFATGKVVGAIDGMCGLAESGVNSSKFW